MISFSTDKQLNILLVKIVGKNSPEEIKKAAAKILLLAQELKDDFSIITDLSLYRQNQNGELDFINKIHQVIVNQFKVYNVYRVIGNSKELLLDLSAGDKKHSIKNIRYVPNLKTALDQLRTAKSLS